MNVVSKVTAKDIVGTAVSCASRLVCVVCIVWIGVIVLQAVSLFSTSNNTGEAKSLTPSEFAGAALLLPQDGFWSFDQTCFDIQSRHVSTEELTQRFETAATKTTASQIDASSFIAVAQLNNAVRTDLGSKSTWMIQTSGLRALLVTSQSEPPCLVTAVVAKENEHGWELFEFGKSHDPMVDSLVSSDHLLPLPDRCIRLCSRQSGSGRLLMELIQTDASGESLLQQWREAGWEIRHSKFGSPLGFSYLCVKDARVVYAWSAATIGPRTLMLSKSDDVKTLSSASAKRTRPQL